MQAELYQTLGSIYQKLGNLDRADTLLEAALEQRRSLFGAEHPDVARSLVALGLLRSDQAEYDEAERLVARGTGDEPPRGSRPITLRWREPPPRWARCWRTGAATTRPSRC